MKEFIYMLFSFFKTRLLTIISVLIIWTTSVVIYFLYNLWLEPIFYTITIGLVFLFCIGIFDFYHYYIKHQALQRVRDNIETELFEMPFALNNIERDYQEIVKRIYKEKIDIVSQNDIKKKETTDYYTMWVHQIKTPIAAMRLMLDASQQNAKLATELFQIEQYVDMAINYVRFESINSDLEFEFYNLDDIIGKALKKYSKIFILKKINLNYERANISILTDEKWLCFIFEQLLSNALKYTPHGTISIYMDKKNEKTLLIEDTGIGIREEDVFLVFEKGFTGYNGRLDKKSSGIGLYMSKKVATKLSHQISITSSTTIGTKVSIDLSNINLEAE